MRLSVIVPTIFRPSLGETLWSIWSQGDPDVETIVVADLANLLIGKNLDAVAYEGPRRHGDLVYAECDHPGSTFGNAQRDLGMSLATGDMLLFLDDDDVYRPGALAAGRRTAEAAPGSPVIFRAEWGAGHHAVGYLLWGDRQVRVSNIATPMVWLPNQPYSRTWMSGNAAGIVSDFEFLGSAICEAGEPVWDETVIATVRPAVR